VQIWFSTQQTIADKHVQQKLSADNHFMLQKHIPGRKDTGTKLRNQVSAANYEPE